MKQTNNWTNYEERFSRVIAHIYDHLDEDLDLYRLADVACLSPYHWHRIYHAVYGETLADTVKRLRLHRAAGYLAHTSMAIKEIAERSGYPNLQSFTRIFNSVYGMPPAQYRLHGSHTHFQPQNHERTLAMYDVAIKTVPEMKTATIPHAGSYMEIGRAFDTLHGWLASHGRLDQKMRLIALYYDDPSSVAEEKLRSRAGVVVDSTFVIEPPLEPAEICAGTYAVLRHKGPYATMKAAYEWLYGQWLVQSGKETADAPVFEEYLNTPMDTAPSELLTDIYLPLK